MVDAKKESKLDRNGESEKQENRHSLRQFFSVNSRKILWWFFSIAFFGLAILIRKCGLPHFLVSFLFHPFVYFIDEFLALTGVLIALIMLFFVHGQRLVVCLIFGTSGWITHFLDRYLIFDKLFEVNPDTYIQNFFVSCMDDVLILTALFCVFCDFFTKKKWAFSGLIRGSLLILCGFSAIFVHFHQSGFIDQSVWNYRPSPPKTPVNIDMEAKEMISGVDTSILDALHLTVKSLEQQHDIENEFIKLERFAHGLKMKFSKNFFQSLIRYGIISLEGKIETIEKEFTVRKVDIATRRSYEKLVFDAAKLKNQLLLREQEIIVLNERIDDLTRDILNWKKLYEKSKAIKDEKNIRNEIQKLITDYADEWKKKRLKT